VVALGREINKGSEDLRRACRDGNEGGGQQLNSKNVVLALLCILYIGFFWLIEGKDLIICTYFS
jgi:hypothetical protein